MKPDLITFDCAQTLVEVDWKLGEFAVTCAERCGLSVPPAASDLYANLYSRRHQEYLELNLTKDSGRCDAFWNEITKDWLAEMGFDAEEWHSRLKEVSDRIGFSSETEIFRVYEDVIPTLKSLRAAGIKTAIVSNWDYTLHRILEALDLRRHFDLVIASLEEGPEKPDPRIFLLALEQLGVHPEAAVHVGDDPIDDLQGARNVGMRALLIDRKLRSPASPPYIASLSDLPGAIGWNE